MLHRIIGLRLQLGGVLRLLGSGYSKAADVEHAVCIRLVDRHVRLAQMGKLKEVGLYIVLGLISKTVHGISLVNREQDKRTKWRPGVVHYLHAAIGTAWIWEGRTGDPSLHRQAAGGCRHQRNLAAVF